MNRAPQTLAALLVTFGLCVSSAGAASVTQDDSMIGGTGISAATASLDLIARKGADDPRPETGCDDHGSDVCEAVLARKGADDPRPEPGCDDHGTDICMAPVSI